MNAEKLISRTNTGLNSLGISAASPFDAYTRKTLEVKAHIPNCETWRGVQRLSGDSLA